MRRREFIVLVGGAAVTWPLVSRAQQGERMRRIGMLMTYTDSDSEAQVFVRNFAQGLAELGWIDAINRYGRFWWSPSLGTPMDRRQERADVFEYTADYRTLERSVRTAACGRLPVQVSGRAHTSSLRSRACLAAV